MLPTIPLESTSRRLFLALWPPADLLPMLQSVAELRRQQCGGELIPTANFHVTLLFLGQVDRQTEAALCGQLDALAFPSFTVEFSHIATWSKGLQVLVSDHPLPELHYLQTEVKAIAAGLGIAVEGRPYAPHISLVRKAERAAAAAAPDQVEQRVTWRAGEIALVESMPHARVAPRSHSIYLTLKRWSANATPAI